MFHMEKALGDTCSHTTLNSKLTKLLVADYTYSRLTIELQLINHEVSILQSNFEQFSNCIAEVFR